LLPLPIFRKPVKNRLQFPILLRKGQRRRLVRRRRMKKLAAAFAVVMAALLFDPLFPSIVVADDMQGIDLLPRSAWEISYQVFYFDYEEEVDGDKFMELDGIMHGVRLAYTSHSGRGLMFRVDGSLNFGQLDYDGGAVTYVDGELIEEPLEADSDDFLLNLQGIVGWDFEHWNIVSTLYTGLAFRYWNDEVDNEAGYEREITQFYLPVGYGIAVPVGSNLIIGGEVDVRVLLGGSVKSHFSDIDPSWDDAENTQDFGSGFGINSSLYLKYDSEWFPPLAVGVFANYYDIDKSDMDVVAMWEGEYFGGYEPENETLEAGVRVSLFW
jgi:hypothetical protein